eukprot:2792995-Prymnesium_polylepis.1
MVCPVALAVWAYARTELRLPATSDRSHTASVHTSGRAPRERTATSPSRPLKYVETCAERGRHAHSQRRRTVSSVARAAYR